MQQLAESLANELLNEPRPPQEQQQEQMYQPQRWPPPPTAFAFVGDLNPNNGGDGCCPSPTAVVSAGGIGNVFSFTAAGSSTSPNFTAREETGPAESFVATGSTVVGKCCSSPSPKTEKKSGGGGGRKPSSSVKEHVIAERKRREKMHYQFATLASIIPDITKVRVRHMF